MIKRFVCILIKTLGCKRRNETIVNLFQKTAARLPDKTMMTLCSESGDTSMTFRECLDKSLRIAHYFRNAGYVQGDIVCIAMENRLDYCCYWMGLGMIGVTPALINNNLRQVTGTQNVSNVKGLT